MVSTAHEQFKKLRMWPEAVECLIIAERNVEAEDMLKDTQWNSGFLDFKLYVVYIYICLYLYIYIYIYTVLFLTYLVCTSHHLFDGVWIWYIMQIAMPFGAIINYVQVLYLYSTWYSRVLFSICTRISSRNIPLHGFGVAWVLLGQNAGLSGSRAGFRLAAVECPTATNILQLLFIEYAACSAGMYYTNYTHIVDK